MGIIRINSELLNVFKRTDGGNKNIWTLQNQNDTYFVKRPINQYVTHAEGFGSFITHKYYPKSICCKIALDEKKKLYILSRKMDEEKKIYYSISKAGRKLS